MIAIGSLVSWEVRQVQRKAFGNQRCLGAIIRLHYSFHVATWCMGIFSFSV